MEIIALSLISHQNCYFAVNFSFNKNELLLIQTHIFQTTIMKKIYEENSKHVLHTVISSQFTATSTFPEYFKVFVFMNLFPVTMSLNN